MAIKTPRGSSPGYINATNVFTIITLRLTLTFGQRILREAHIWSKLQHGYILPVPEHNHQLLSDSINRDSVDEEWTRARFRSRSASLGVLKRLETIGGLIKSFTQIQ